MKVYSRSRNSRFWANNLGLERYAYLPKMRRIYEWHTGNLPMERFAFVGMMEEYEESLALFKAIFGIEIPYYRVNVNEKVPGKFSTRQKEAVQASLLSRKRMGTLNFPKAGVCFAEGNFLASAASIRPFLCFDKRPFCPSTAFVVQSFLRD